LAAPCAAVFAFLLCQKNLGLVDVTKEVLTSDSVRLNYVHGIWYEVSSAVAAVAVAAVAVAALAALAALAAAVSQHLD